MCLLLEVAGVGKERVSCGFSVLPEIFDFASSSMDLCPEFLIQAFYTFDAILYPQSLPPLFYLSLERKEGG